MLMYLWLDPYACAASAFWLFKVSACGNVAFFMLPRLPKPKQCHPNTDMLQGPHWPVSVCLSHLTLLSSEGRCSSFTWDPPCHPLVQFCLAVSQYIQFCYSSQEFTCRPSRTVFSTAVGPSRYHTKVCIAVSTTSLRPVIIAQPAVWLRVVLLLLGFRISVHWCPGELTLLKCYNN